MSGLLRRHRRAVAERRVQCVPAEARALYARRKLAHPGERGELAERGIGCDLRLSEECMDPFKQRPHLAAVLALDSLGHERRRGGGNGAALALEADIGDALAVQTHGQRQVVAAQGVMALGAPVGALEWPEIARATVVIEDHVAVEILQIHQVKTSCARLSAATSRATSLSVL